MGEAVKIGLISAAIWVLGKTVMYFIDPLMPITSAIYLNIFLLLGAIAFGLYRTMMRETEESNTLNDIKNGMKAGLSYSVVVGASIYLFYAVINPGYNEYQIAQMDESITEAVNNPEELAKIRKSNEAFEVKTKEEIIAELKKGPRSFFNAGSTFTLSILAMLLLSTLYSILVSLILRKVVFKKA
ncbi:MAG: DUF4199 domain-containing protein [Crocinitomicaceae bacterium]|jgi:hypothetical protein|nr:DUF4199 domain-containing protein [Crocinitomicaceae bacterium]